MLCITDDEFDEVCQRALASIPERFAKDIDNVGFVIEDDPSPWHLSRLADGAVIKSPENPHGGKLLMGLYSGIALPRRGSGYGYGNVPDVITIFKNPHLLVSANMEDLEERVRRTMVHEIGHYFGMDEDQLRAMGYGSS